MAKSLIPDPLELMRQAVTHLEGRANSLAGRGLEIDQVVKTLHQLSSRTLVVRQAMELALDNFYKRLNLPTGREFAEMRATLQRLEDKLDSLLATEVSARAAPRPARTRQPMVEAPAAKAETPRPARTRQPVVEPAAAKVTKIARAAKTAKAAAPRTPAAPARRARRAEGG